MQRLGDVVLPDDVGERLGPVAAVEGGATRATLTLAARPRTAKWTPAHPPEPAYPCCLPALGEFREMTPHEGSPSVYADRRSPAVSDAQPVTSAAEDSPSGLWRTLGKRVGVTPRGFESRILRSPDVSHGRLRLHDDHVTWSSCTKVAAERHLCARTPPRPDPGRRNAVVHRWLSRPQPWLGFPSDHADPPRCRRDGLPSASLAPGPRHAAGVGPVGRRSLRRVVVVHRAGGRRCRAQRDPHQVLHHANAQAPKEPAFTKRGDRRRWQRHRPCRAGGRDSRRPGDAGASSSVPSATPTNRSNRASLRSATRKANLPRQLSLRPTYQERPSLR